ncbi:MAG TPA: HAD family hydrolase [Solimonas sp.]
MHETIAVVFDFDDTLAPDTTTGYLRDAGLGDVARFWKEEVGPLTLDDWDPVPAYLRKMIEVAAAGRIPPITRERLADWGRRAPLHDGVDTLFARLRRAAVDANPRVNLEFYVISSGIGDVLRATTIAHEFKDIWASEFHYDASGAAAFPKKIVSFTDKTRYLFHVQKGLIGKTARGRPFDVNRKLPPDQIRVPLNRMIFVGDGYTDIPCFSLLKQHGGVPIAVYDPHHEEKWGNAFQFVSDNRVSNINSANYSEKSDLSNFLIMAVRKLANDILLAERIYQG